MMAEEERLVEKAMDGGGASRHGRSANFLTQANALLRKNLIIQKRNMQMNIGLILFPALLCLLLYSIQKVVDTALDLKEVKHHSCDAATFYTEPTGQVPNCAIPSPPKWPVLLQIPNPQFRATRNPLDTNLFPDLPQESCKKTGSCPIAVLLTGGNRSFAESLGQNLFLNAPINSTVDLDDSGEYLLGTDAYLPSTYFVEGAFISDNLYNIQPKCQKNSTFTLAFEMDILPNNMAVKCVEGLHLWRESSSDINAEVYKGFPDGNPEKKINEFVAAYDFLDTSDDLFNVIASYNSAHKATGLTRISRSLNMASNSYLRLLKGVGVKVMIEFVKEMPKGQTTGMKFDPSALFGPLFYTWVIDLLFPVMLTYLVYEKQQKLRTIMRMHGLANAAYWTISYAYFLVISSAYILCFVYFGIIIGLRSSKLNSYSVQFAFYFVYINLQISFAFLASTMFSQVKIASVMGYMYVFASGLLGFFLFEKFIQDADFPRTWIFLIEILPCFSFYRGLYELSQYSFSAQLLGVSGMTWKDVINDKDGMGVVLIIMAVEWIVMLPTAYYLDKIGSVGDRTKRCSRLFSPFSYRTFSPPRKSKAQEREGYNVCVDMEKPDIFLEREIVDKFLMENNQRHAIICDNLRKIYSGKDGNSDKYAVRGLSLAVPRGECLGILGPNGAGKTSFINMMTGLISPTSGTAFVHGLDITKDMEKVYSSMGVCPQHDLVWEMLTGREHLLFYGRLKNLKGHALTRAVEESLASVNLNDKGVPDKQSGTYSGGMRRRLSVAISLIGNPQVVYMDEPSTGLDPASRNTLWEVVKQAKQDKAVILTTHSMEEAEILCDRIGIFVNGHLQCLGSPVELKARYGGHYVLTITASSQLEKEVDDFVHQLSPRAVKTYHVSGTHKYELPKAEVSLSNVFKAIEHAKRKFEIHAWGLADSTLEDVFITVAKNAEAMDEL